MPYAALGSAQVMSKRIDPILSHSSVAAKKIMAQITATPVVRREAEMNRLLNDLEPGLAGKVRKVANTLGHQTTSKRALEGALKLVLADWAVANIAKMGKKRRISTSGLGSAGTVARNIGVALTCGIAQSDEARTLATRQAGGTNTTGGATTSVGFDVARQICPHPDSGGSELPAPPAPPPTSSIPWVPILIGGTLLVGLVVFVKMS